MNNIKQALKSAIEVMELKNPQEAKCFNKKCDEALQACKEALESAMLERDYNFMRDLAVGCEDAWNKLQEQKPIATIQAPDPYDERDGVWFDLSGLQRLKKLATGTKLYTSPPQQQWVGLSDAEIFELCPYIDHDLLEEAFYRGARAIEAKLKELNT